MNVRVTDRGYAALMKRIDKLSGQFALGPYSVEIGIHEEDGAKAYANGMTVADVGAIHEFGLGNNPRRSFLADWFEENQKTHQELIKKAMVNVVAGRWTLEQAASALGVKLEGDCKRRLTSTPGDWEPLKPETIARKGSSKPLIDRGVLRASITHKVEKGG